jgi:transposase
VQACRHHSKKKTLNYSEQDSDAVIEATIEFLDQLDGVRPEDLVFGDEMGCNLTMTPAYGRAEAGQRVHDAVPSKRGKNISTIGVMGFSGLIATLMVEGAFNADLVYDFIDRYVVQHLRPGQVLVLDNARIHKKRLLELRLLLARKGCRLVFLPPYSPEWNPIENAWSKMKELIRRAKARTRDALLDAIVAASAAITASDAQGWFRLCGHV